MNVPYFDKETLRELAAEKDKEEITKLREENAKLKRRNRKLEQYRLNHDDVKKWARDMLEIKRNDQSLMGLLYMLDHVERRLYKGRADDER